MVTVSKLIRLLVSFHAMMLVNCLKQCLAYNKRLMNTDFPDTGETAQAKVRWVSPEECEGVLLGYSQLMGQKAQFDGI